MRFQMRTAQPGFGYTPLDVGSQAHYPMLTRVQVARHGFVGIFKRLHSPICRNQGTTCTPLRVDNAQLTLIGSGGSGHKTCKVRLATQALKPRTCGRCSYCKHFYSNSWRHLWELSQNQSMAESAQDASARSNPQSADIRSDSKEAEPSLAAIQFKKIMKELRETRKMATEALEKSKGNHSSQHEGPKRSKRKERIELFDGSSTKSTHSDGQHNDHEDHRDQMREFKKSKDSELRRQIEKIVKGYKPQTPAELAVEAAKGICKSPFTSDILKAKKPAKFTQPKFKLFEGVADPTEHIYHFQQQMVLESEDEALLCKLFLSSLSGSALTWFRQKKDITALFSTKQKVGESLKDYLKRFMEEMSTLETYDSHTASLAFREGVTS
ncbi:unnamed protein product [Prunus brigantina]